MNIKQFVNTIIAAFTKPHSTAPTTEEASAAWELEWHAGNSERQPQQEQPAGTAAFLEGWDKATQSAALWEADEGPVNYDPVRYDDEFFPQ